MKRCSSLKSSRGFADLSQVGESKLLQDEILYQFRIIASPLKALHLRLNSCRDLLLVMKSTSVNSNMSETLLTGLRECLRASEQEPALVQALLSVLLTFLARETLNENTNSSPILSLDLLQQVLGLAVASVPNNRFEKVPIASPGDKKINYSTEPDTHAPRQEEGKSTGRLKRKFSSSTSQTFSPETKIREAQSPSSTALPQDTSFLWEAVNESFMGSYMPYPATFVLASVFVNRFFALAIERLNSLSSGALQQSAGMEEQAEDADDTDDDLERASTISSNAKSAHSSESYQSREAQRSIRSIEDAKQFLEQAQTLLTAEVGSGGGSSSYKSSYMEKVLVCLGLHIKEVLVLSSCSVSSDDGSAPTEQLLVYARVWLFLGILESACFNFPSNQVIISKIAVAKSSDRSSSLTISTLLMKCLQRMAPLAILACNQDLYPIEQLSSEDRHFAALFVDFPFASLSIGAEMLDSVLSLKTVDLFLSCLKALVTLTNHCTEAAMPIVGNADMLKWSFGLLAYSLHWKQSPVSKDHNTSASETMVERYVFDWTLFVMALTTNLVEACSQSFMGHVFDSLCFDSVLSVVEQGPFVSLFPKNATTILRNTMLDYIVSTLLEESAIFLRDLVVTDDKIGMKASSPSAPVSLSGDSNDDEVPVSELIFSAHLCLMLHTCLFGKLSADKSGVVSSSSGFAVDSARACQAVLRRLPRQSWWLSVRVLKGYLALQGQSGVLMVENFVPCLITIAHLEQLNTLSFDSYPTPPNSQETPTFGSSPGSDLHIRSSSSSSSSNSTTKGGNVDWLPSVATSSTVGTNAVIATTTNKRYTYGSSFVSAQIVEPIEDVKSLVATVDSRKGFDFFSESSKLSYNSSTNSSSPKKASSKSFSKLSSPLSPRDKTLSRSSTTSVASWEDDDAFSFRSPKAKVDVDVVDKGKSIPANGTTPLNGSQPATTIAKQLPPRVPTACSTTCASSPKPLSADASPGDSELPLKRLYAPKMKYSVETTITNNVFGLPLIQRDPTDGWRAKRKFAK